VEALVGTKVGKSEEFPEGEVRVVEYEGRKVCIARVEGALYGVDNMCSHAEAYLSEGELYAEDLEIECPLHGSTFNLVDGEPQDLPASEPVRAYEVVEDSDEVEIVKQTNDA